MIRVIIDSQSNRLFRGVEMEQDYDQRGGLCQAGKDDVVITTNPINEGYLRYWEGIGFELPHFLVAGPFDPQYTLSELIMNNHPLRKDLQAIVNGHEARLEFFTIEEIERKLSQELGIPAYCNFDVSLPLSRKHRFKLMFEEIGLMTPMWELCEKKDHFFQQATHFLEKHGRFLLKSSDGTGGISCNGMAKIESHEDIIAINQRIGDFGCNMVLERIIDDKEAEVSLHWEMTADGGLKIIDIFGQLAVNFGYAGAYFPVSIGKIKELIKYQFESVFAPALKCKGALGFYCCDIIIDSNGVINWIDFNPRKGAIIYAHSMARRMAEVHFEGSDPFFYHKHNRVEGVEGKDAFSLIQEKLSDLMIPNDKAFVIVTNPGVMEFGYVDITGISSTSLDDAREVFDQALKRL